MSPPIPVQWLPLQTLTALGLLRSTGTMLGGAAAAAVLDHFLLQPLVEKGILPEEARVPLLFGGFTGAHAALHKFGLVSSSTAQGLRSIPTFTGFQTLANALLGLAGAKPGFKTDLASLLLASTPYIAANFVPAISEALAAAAAGKGLAVKGLSRGAAALQIGATAVRVLGWATLLDFGGNLIADGVVGNLYCAFKDDTETCEQLWKLIRLSMQISENEALGGFLAALLPTIPSSAEPVIKIRDQLVKSSDELGEWINDNLLHLVFSNAKMGEDQTISLDWEAVQEGLRKVYQNEENAEPLKNGYKLVETATAPMTSGMIGIRDLIKEVDLQGEVQDWRRLKAHIYRTVLFKFTGLKDDIQKRAVELGLAEWDGGDEDAVWKIPQNVTETERSAYLASLNDEQRRFLQVDLMQWALYLRLAETIEGEL